MSTPTIEIIEPGLLTSVQDKGRYGYQKYGVPVSGAMDEFSFRSANVLSGNAQNAAALEITAIPPDVRFLTDTWASLTGAELSPKLDGLTVPSWESFEIKAGSILNFGEMQNGLRSYLAIAGGIDVPLVMGSRSTYIKGGFGGYHGRILKTGDVIDCLDLDCTSVYVKRKMSKEYEINNHEERNMIRVILGTQTQISDPEVTASLLRSTYIVSHQSDRMGYVLEGPEIAHKNGPDVISSGNQAGAIQVPGSGNPTILLADRGTTGGYKTIATVIKVDIGKLSQLSPGQPVNFTAVSIEEAHRLVRDLEDKLNLVQLQNSRDQSNLKIIVDGQSFEMADESGNSLQNSDSSIDTPGTGSHKAQVKIDGTQFDFTIDIQN